MRRFPEARVDVGRAESTGLRFDPGTDLHVSALHARFERIGDEWWISDLGSRNGTWVDGARVDDPVRVRVGQRIRFGWEGPEVERVAGPHAPPPDDAARGLARRNHVLTALLAVVVVGAVAVVTLSARGRASATEAWEQERAALVARTDSALAAGRQAVAALEGEIDGLADALSASESRVRELQAELETMARSGRPDPAELARLRAQIDAATATVSGQRRAADLDAVGLLAAIRPAVVMVYAEFADGRRTISTGFAVSTDGRILTNRHAVSDPEGGETAVRIGVQFSGSTQTWPADLVRTADEVDLALLQAQRLVGANRSVAGINPRPDTVAVGTPVLLVGFPGATPAPATGPPPRAVAMAGAVAGLQDDWLTLEGWGAAGASGSPVVGEDGRVMGVLVGASSTPGDGRLVAVPGFRIAAFLRD